MRLKSLKASGLKHGGDISLEFPIGPEPVVITGASFAGKTRYLDALKIALYGHHPQLGKQATGKLMAGQSMTVRAELDNGTTIVRKVSRNEKGGLKFDYGSQDIKLPDLALDFNCFLSLTGPKQVEYIVSKADQTKAGFTAEQVKAELRVVSSILEPDLTGDSSNLLEWLGNILGVFCGRAQTAKKSAEAFSGAIKAGAIAENGKVISKLDRYTAETLRNALISERAEKVAQREQIQRLASQQAQYAALKEELSKRPDFDAAIARAQKEIAALEATNRTVPDVRPLTQAVNDIAVQFSVAKSALLALEEEQGKTQNRLDELEKAECCPFCESKGKGWKSALKKKLTAELKALEAKLQVAVTDWEAKSHALDEAKETEADALAAVARAQDLVTSETRMLEQRRMELANLKREQEAYEQKKSLLASFTSLGVVNGNPEELTAEILNLDAKIKAVTDDLNTAIQAQADALRIEQARQNLAAAETQLWVYKQAVEVVRGYQDKLVQVCMKDILGTARKFTDGIIPGQLDYHDGELGQWIGKEWASHETMSGTEKALTYSAMSVALTSGSPLRIVILDEVGVMDDDVAKLVVFRLYDLVQDGIINQAVLVDRDANRYSSDAHIVRV